MEAAQTLLTISPSAYKSAITVATDGTGQFTAINAALSYAQNSGYPTVTILAGTYTEAISVQATGAVTVVGQSSSFNDYTQNQVIVQNSEAPLTIATQAILGVTWRNINFITSATNAVYLRGTKNQFIGCQMIS